MSKQSRRTFIKASVGAALTLPAAGRLQAATPARGSNDLGAAGLRCENVVDPLGVDVPRPRVSWRITAAGAKRGRRQTAYQILAASTAALLAAGHGDLWDSGKVASANSLHVPYDGRPPVSAQQVFWKVRVWDETGAAPSAWSAPGTWTMGLLDPADWTAKWIGAPGASALIGYHAAETTGEFDTKWVQVDLGAPLPISEVRLIPMDHAGAKGFGFPHRFTVEAANDPDFGNAAMLLDESAADYPSPGIAPVTAAGHNLAARYVRVTGLKLWKRDATIYSFALSQLEVISGGRNVAAGKPVTAKDSYEGFGWGHAGLTDGRGPETPGPQQSVLLRHEFTAAPKLRRALLFIAGLGQYELSINGRRIDDGLLAPGWSFYKHTCLYDTHDITDALQAGRNALGITLGNGMYDIKPDPVRYVKFLRSDGPPRAIAQILLTYADGTTETVASDTRWQTAPGPITFSNIFAGEDYDARLQPTGWDRPGFAGAWAAVVETTGPGGTLRGLTRAAPPIRAIETLAPAKVTAPAPNVHVYDFGQNASVMPRLAVHGPAGSSVRMIPSELLGPNGNVDRASCTQDGVRPAWWQYTLSGAGPEQWFPKFFYHGSRYFQVELRPAEGGTELPVIDRLESVVVHSSSRPIGTFETSSDLFNRIYALVRWAERSNMMSLMTDCPHRERLGWLEETQLNGPSLRYNFDMAALMSKVMNDMKDSQLENGFVPNIAPEYFIASTPKLTDGFRNSPEWGSAFVLVPWQQYQFSGDTGLLDRYYDSMKRYVAFLAGTAQDDIVPTGLGDWYDVGPKPAWGSQLTPVAFTATAFFYYDNWVMAQAAALLGKTDDAAQFTSNAERIRASFNRKFYLPATGTYSTGSQTCCAIPLAMGIVDQDQRDRVLQALIAGIRGHGNALTSGEIGYRFLIRALADAGRSDVLFDLNNQTDKPGYGYQIAHGGTSLAEKWDGSVGSFGSQCHFMSGEIMEWFFHDLVGIGQQPGSGGFEKITIRPAIAGDLTFVRGVHDSVRGPISVEWRRAGDRLTVAVSVPPNATATAAIPAAHVDDVLEGGKPLASASGVQSVRSEDGRVLCEIGSGSYTFTSMMPPAGTIS